jgi:hypothetical protein
MPVQFEFNPTKALAVAAYFANRTGESMYTILKMIYLADRCHLERYGRPITGDDFIAMKQGACPSKIYDSMKVLRGDTNTNYLPNSENFLEVDAESFDVNVKDLPSLEVLSATDIECLDEIVSIHKRLGRWAIRRMAHDAAWKKTNLNGKMNFLDIAKSVKDGDVLAKHLETRFA